MSNQQNRKSRDGVVYSTADSFEYSYNSEDLNQETLKPAQQNLKVMLDKKQRAGKKVTLISGFIVIHLLCQHSKNKSQFIFFHYCYLQINFVSIEFFLLFYF